MPIAKSYEHKQNALKIADVHNLLKLGIIVPDFGQYKLNKNTIAYKIKNFIRMRIRRIGYAMTEI